VTGAGLATKFLNPLAPLLGPAYWSALGGSNYSWGVGKIFHIYIYIYIYIYIKKRDDESTTCQGSQETKKVTKKIRRITTGLRAIGN